MKLILLLYVAAVVYSAIRYIVFAPKNLENLPVFVVNKGVSMAAAFCFAIAFVVQRRMNRQGVMPGVAPQAWFRAGICGVFAHIPMSLAILQPSYFPEFYHQSGRMKMAGEAVFLFGALTAVGIYMLTRQDWSRLHRWGLSLATMLVLFTHTLFMGLSRGLNINASHAYLPPMWLLSLVGIALGVLFLIGDRPPKASDPIA